jgi:hypothetical protein
MVLMYQLLLIPVALHGYTLTLVKITELDLVKNTELFDILLMIPFPLV